LHGVDTAFFTPLSQAPVDGPIHLLTTGSWLRDWTLLASVASQLIGENIVLDVVSSSAPAFVGQPNIEVHRDVNDVELRDLYRRAHLLVLPLHDATANNALLEAMASGLPVVASNLPSLREYAPPPIARFVEHHADAFVVAIRSLLSDADARGRMATEGIQRAEELSWPSVARRFVTLYRQVGGR
jgi:glycosyltransferase involved in cell wall biosynthesis